jgi:predicted nucleic acid-binding protein
VTDEAAPALADAPLAVLDTSVLLSSHRHWLWLLARLGYFRGVWSTFIVGELVRIRVEHSIRLRVPRAIYRERINKLVHLLSDVLLVADYRTVEASGLVNDPDDEPILATALAAGAELVVSLNTRDFPSSGQVANVQFLTPVEFLTFLESRQPTGPARTIADEAGRQLP